MNKYIEVWEPVLKLFEERYPKVSSIIVDWFPCGQNEVMFKTNNGEKIIFNCIDMNVRVFKNADDGSELSEDKWRNEFSIRLANKMAAAGIPRWELSRLSGISEVSISKYTNGKATPSGFIISKLARALKCSESELSDFTYLWEG